MKKVLLAAAVLMCMGTVAFAGGGPQFGTPRGDAQALATADYGGVYVATSQFPVSGTAAHYSTVTIPNVNGTFVRGVFYGVIFSSGTTVDFVDVYDSTSADKAKNEGPYLTRLYNVGSSTGGIGATSYGFSGPPKPMGFIKGCLIRASRGDLNHVTSLYYAEPSRPN